MLISSTLFFLPISPVKAENGYANVYILCLDGVPCANFGVSDNQTAKNAVRDGAIAASIFLEGVSNPYAHPKAGNEPPFYSISYHVVTDWSTYANIIESYHDCIVVNTHGEIFPIPAGWYGLGWINKTADAVLNRGITWVHTGGYPFYYIWNQPDTSKSMWPSDGTFGFRNFTSNIGMPDVTCGPTSPGNEEDLKTIGGYAEQNLGHGWDTASAKFAERGRPLHASDFQNYTVLPIWSFGGDYPGAVVSFAKPSQRKLYTDQSRSGFYVHVGTRQVYTNDQPPYHKNYDENYMRGYIGAAAAIWAETSAFSPTAAIENYGNHEGGRSIDYASNWTVGVEPFIASYYYPDSTDLNVILDFPIYGLMKTEYSQHHISKVRFNLESPEPGACSMAMQADNKSSSVLNNAGGFVFQFSNEKLIGALAKTPIYLAEILCFFTGQEEFEPLFLTLGGAELFSDYASIISVIDNPDNSIGVNKLSSCVQFDHTPQETEIQISGYSYKEFESTIEVTVTLNLANKQQWNVIPLRSTITLFDENWEPAVSVNTGLDIAAYNTQYDQVNGFRSTVFFDSFQNGFGSWQATDLNYLSGFDYWGTMGAGYGAAPCAWCAAVGNNSARAYPYTDTPNYYPPYFMAYDKNMNATMTYTITSSPYVNPYRNMWLSYNLTYDTCAGDYLYVEYCTNPTAWHGISGLQYTGIGNDFQYDVGIPIYATAIRFRFCSTSNSDGTHIGALIRYVELRADMPNDTLSGGDAGNSVLTATSLRSPSAGYLVASDQDYYNFTVSRSDINNEDPICFDLYPATGTDFEATLKDPRGNPKGGPAQHIEYDLSYGDYSGSWTIRIYPVKGFGVYNYFLSLGGGGGCPYVFAWNGHAFVKDNNVLPASESGNGTDAKDYYTLEQPVVPIQVGQRTSWYSLQIREFENEQDYIDQVKLIAVDHSSNSNIAATPEGGITTYTTPTSPLLCFDDNNVSRLSEIGRMDGNVFDQNTYFQGNEGDWLLLDFGRVVAANANLILRDDYKCMDVCINVQVPNVNGSWQTVEVLHPRDSWAIEAVNMTAYLPADNDFIVRLLWTATHRLDYVGLDTSSPATIQVYSTVPTLAVHSTLGVVSSSLLYDDENCVELVNGQRITLAFAIPNTGEDLIRDFIFYTNGYYYSIDP